MRQFAERHVLAGAAQHRDGADPLAPRAVGLGVLSRPHLDRNLAAVGLEEVGLRLEALGIGIGDRAQYLIDPQILVEERHGLGNDLNLGRAALQVGSDTIGVDLLQFLEAVLQIVGDHLQGRKVVALDQRRFGRRPRLQVKTARTPAATAATTLRAQTRTPRPPKPPRPP